MQKRDERTDLDLTFPKQTSPGGVLPPFQISNRSAEASMC